MITNLLDFLIKISTLRRAPEKPRSPWGTGDSPYKLILFFCIVMAMHRKKMFKNRIVHFKECPRLFQETYQLLFPAGQLAPLEPKVVQPFYYLGSGDQIWRLVAQKGMITELNRAIKARRRITTEGVLNRLVDYAEFSKEDYALLRNPLAAKTLLYSLAAENFKDLATLPKLLNQIALIR
jgi:hypothetical protein